VERMHAHVGICIAPIVLGLKEAFVRLTSFDSAASGFMLAAAARHVGCRHEAVAAMGELQPT
jgi:hypothetical protein